MKNFTYQVRILEYENQEELPAADRELLKAAKQAISQAYAPYSAYQVGAAVLLDNGLIITGNNQENAAYPSGLCAERGALFYASSQYPDVPVKAIAITARARDFRVESPVAPCGACRQVLAETESRFNNNIRLIMTGDNGKIHVAEGIGNLLPFMFQAEGLKKK